MNVKSIETKHELLKRYIKTYCILEEVSNVKSSSYLTFPNQYNFASFCNGISIEHKKGKNCM